MGLTTPSSVQKLQTALHAKAKGSPDLRFYTLYDKMCRVDVLAFAYDCCRANRGAAGVDDQTFGDIEAYGRERWLGELAEELKRKTYRPEAVRRVMIPKPGQPKRTRPLGIPTIRDRVAQMAAVLVLEPVFETDLQPEQYAYRPKRSALDAVQHVHKLLNTGHTEVVDADLSGYFDGIPHAELMKSAARRISDGSMLHLIKMWLEAPVEETDDCGNQHRTTRNKDDGRGTPQGAPISPLLSNLYMRRFVLGWKVMGHDRRLDAHIVNYADDCAPRTHADWACGAALEMGAGPSESTCRSRFQTTLSGGGQEPRVVSVMGKGTTRSCQVRIKETSASEPLKTRRKRRDDVKTGRQSLTQDQPERNLLTARVASGVKVA